MTQSKTPKKKEKVEKVADDKTMSVAKQIEQILLKNEMALQPYLNFSEHGVVPRVRLVTVKQENPNGKGTDKETDSGAKEQDGTAEAPQS